MKITNRYGLPPALVTAVAKGSQYAPRPDRIGVTDLIGPPQMRRLTMEHWDEIEEDVSDRIWALFGQAVHAVLHAGADLNSLTEEKLTLEVDGLTIAGKADLYEQHGLLTDWKNMSAWGIVFGDVTDVTAQLNVYATMYRAHGFTVTGLQRIAFLRDWSRRQAQRDAQYPQQPVVVTPISLWSVQDTAAYIMERVALHQAAHTPPCTAGDRWEKPTTYAVMKNDNKRAARVLESALDAAQWIHQQKPGPKYAVVTRPGEQTRCQSYCRVGGANNWCPQWTALRPTEPLMGDDEAQAYVG